MVGNGGRFGKKETKTKKKNQKWINIYIKLKGRNKRKIKYKKNGIF